MDAFSFQCHAQKRLRDTSRFLETLHGLIPYPTYVPVTTFGEAYPLDQLIRPYLPRLADCVMVSHFYAKQMNPTERPSLPMMVDSGGFSSLFQNSKVEDRNGLGVIIRTGEDGVEETTNPAEVLDFQEQWADIGFTLDFPIPPGFDPSKAQLRQVLTIANAKWALENRRSSTLKLFAAIQGDSEEMYGESAEELARYPFDGFAIGGLIPRAHNRDLVEAIVKRVRHEIGDRPLHIFGLGHPKWIPLLLHAGADSVDSSSYVKYAVDGKSWWNSRKLIDPHPLDRVQLAIENLSYATWQVLTNPQTTWDQPSQELT